MRLAFVLIYTEMGKDLQVMEALEKIPEVKESFRVYGVYDIIARVEAENLKDVIFPKIRLIEGVKSTMSLIEM